MKATKAQIAAFIQNSSPQQIRQAVAAAKATPDKYSPEFVNVLELALSDMERQHAKENRQMCRTIRRYR